MPVDPRLLEKAQALEAEQRAAREADPDFEPAKIEHIPQAGSGQRANLEGKQLEPGAWVSGLELAIRQRVRAAETLTYWDEQLEQGVAEAHANGAPLSQLQELLAGMGYNVSRQTVHNLVKRARDR